MVAVIILSVAIAIFLSLYLILTWNFNYWRKRSVPYIRPVPYFGNMAGIMLQKETMMDLYKRLYNKHKDYLYCGMYKMGTPAILIRDPELVKSVMVKNFISFHDNDVEVDENIDPIFGNNPFSLKGEKWKNVRNQITTCLTIAKIKTMFPLIEEVTGRLNKFLTTNNECLNAKELALKYTTDVVAYCAFGIDAKSFEDPNSEFRAMGKRVINDDSALNSFKLFIILFLPRLSKLLRLRFMSNEVANFFRNIIKETLQYREDTGITRNDYLDSLVKLKEKNEDVTDDMILAHTIMFFTEGFETSSITISFALYNIAKEKDIAEKLRSEVDDVLSKYKGQITFEAIQEMTYMDCILSETLRMYPPAVALQKICTQKFNLPNPKRNESGPELTIDVGTPVFIPIHALQNDPKYYSSPEIFDPLRFSEAKKHNIEKYTYLPFGEGPRQCLGTKFAFTQIKTAIASIVKHFDISVNPKTIQPLEMDCKLFLTSAKGGIWLDFQKRKED